MGNALPRPGPTRRAMCCRPTQPQLPGPACLSCRLAAQPRALCGRRNGQARVCVAHLPAIARPCYTHQLTYAWSAFSDVEIDQLPTPESPPPAPSDEVRLLPAVMGRAARLERHLTTFAHNNLYCRRAAALPRQALHHPHPHPRPSYGHQCRSNRLWCRRR
jgi:hypothetical protein